MTKKKSLFLEETMAYLVELIFGKYNFKKGLTKLLKNGYLTYIVFNICWWFYDIRFIFILPILLFIYDIIKHRK